MKLSEPYGVLTELWDDELVIVNLGASTWEWHALNRGTDKVWFHQHTTMGLSASLGLGLAINRPEARVWVLDGDGSLLLNAGSLVAVGEQQPPNMIHFVTANRSYRTIGGYPLPGERHVDYDSLGRGFGIENVHVFTTGEECRAQLPAIVESGEFAFVVFEVDSTMTGKDHVPWEGPEQKYRFARHIEKQCGVQVIGPRGH